VPAVSQHLAKLRAAGLVVARREGTSVRYSQPDEHVAALVTNVLQHAEHLLYANPPHHRPIP
jgi:DNA-binding transcriptional ArsR family regulator